MKYAGIIENDVSAGDGICTTLFVQGCPHRCAGCHNPNTWDFNGGKEFTEETFNILNKAINANEIKRNFCIMGGEPLLHSKWLEMLRIARKQLPNTEIWLVTNGILLNEDVVDFFYENNIQPLLSFDGIE